MLYSYFFQFLDADGNIYELRKNDLTQAKVLYRKHGTTDSFTETLDFNVNDENDSLWVRLPQSEGGQTDLVITLNIAPLRTLTTGLQTLTLTPYTTGFKVTATPVPLNSMQGYSPRIIDDYWWQFDDETQTFVNTGIKAEGTVIETGQVDDFAQKGDMNAISSNAVYNIEQTINNSITNISNEVTNIENNVSTLQAHKVSVKLNDTTATEDSDGLVDLGTLEIPVTGYAPSNTTMLTSETDINGTKYPYGTLVYTDADGNKSVVSTDSNRIYTASLSNDASKSEWNLIMTAQESVKFDIYYSVYNTSRGGTCYYIKNGYNGRLVTTSAELAQLLKYDVYMGILRVYAPGAVSPAPIPYVKVVSNDTISWYRAQQDASFDASRLSYFEVFLTTETADWITISDATYSQDPTTLTTTNYIIEQSLNYTFTDELTNSVSLTFKNTGTNSTVTVTDGTFTATSNELNPGDIATLIVEDETNFYWNYSTSKEAVTSVKVNDETFIPVNGLVDLGTIGGGTGSVKSATMNGGTKIEPDADGNLALTSATKTSDLTNDSGFVKSTDFTEIKHTSNYGFDLMYDDTNADCGIHWDVNEGLEGGGQYWLSFAHNNNSNWTFGREYDKDGNYENYLWLYNENNTDNRIKLYDIEAVKFNGTTYNYDATLKGFDLGSISIPTKTSDLTNDSGFVTSDYFYRITQADAGGILFDYGVDKYGYSIVWNDATTSAGKTYDMLAFDLNSDDVTTESWMFLRDHTDGNYAPSLIVRTDDSNSMILNDIETVKFNGTTYNYDATLKGFDLGSISLDDYAKGIYVKNYGTYYSPSDDGYIRLPELKTKVNGTENSFVAQTDADKRVMDLGSICKTVSVNGGDKVSPDTDGNADIDIETYTMEVVSSAVPDPTFNTLADGYQSQTLDFTSTREYVLVWSGGSALELNSTNAQKGDMITVRTTSSTLTSTVTMYTGTKLIVNIGVLGSTTLFYNGSEWKIYR